VSGAGGNIGATYVSRAAPDGYSLLFHQLGMAISPFLYSKLEYDPLDFDTIGMVAYQANVLITRPNFAPDKFNDFLDYLKANKDKLSFASTGPGGASDLCAILFKSATGIDIKTVPYRATAPALTDLMGGNVDLLCDSVATATPFINSGKVQAHGVTTLTRASSLPDVPTLDEQGLKGFDQTTWTALYAPKGTPKPIIDHLAKSLQDAVQDPQFKASLHRVGSSPMPKERATPEALSSFLRQEMDRWGPILKKAHAGGT
jgi:tripartite-type tricarboxylate transporter receptor subunit TctC